MARLALFLLAALALIAQPATSQAGDVFTGYQIDNKSQYFGYLGVRAPVLQMAGGTNLFVQAMTAGLGYSFKSNGQLLDANVQFIVPSLGISQNIGGWTLSAQAGPQMRRIEEQRVNTSASIEHQIGPMDNSKRCTGMRRAASTPSHPMPILINSSGAASAGNYWPTNPTRVVARPMSGGMWQPCKMTTFVRSNPGHSSKYPLARSSSLPKADTNTAVPSTAGGMEESRFTFPFETPSPDRRPAGKHRRLTDPGTGGIDHIPHRGIFNEEPFTGGGDPDSPITGKISLCPGCRQHTGALVPVHRLGGESRWCTRELHPRQFPQVECQLVAVIQDRIGLYAVGHHDKRRGKEDPGLLFR